MMRMLSAFSRCGRPVLVAAAALLVGLTGCGDVNTSSTRISALRIIDASADAGGLDVYANTSALAYNVGFGTVSSYIAFTPATYTFAADQAGSQTVLSSARGTLIANTEYTLLVGNVAASLQTLLLIDQSVPAPSGQVAIRFVDQATHIGAIDIYLVPQGGSLLTTLPVLTGLTFNNATNAPRYINVPTGTYTLIVVPAGTVPSSTTVNSYTGGAVSYPAGSARTIIFLDQQVVTKPGIQVITANDYDSALATS